MEIGPNVQIIIISAIVILSFLFNSFSERTNIPAVLLLIFAGIGLKFGADQLGLSVPDLNGILSVMGTIGLIMIVREAAVDLKVKREKKGILIRSFLIALLVFLISSASLAGLLFELAPNASFADVKGWITSSARPLPGLAGRSVTGGMRRGGREVLPAAINSSTGAGQLRHRRAD